MMINADKPKRWQEDIAASVDLYNAWFMRFAPQTFREKRIEVTQHVEDALLKSKDLTQITPAILRAHPGILPTFRMCACPPLARERLAGLAGVKKTIVHHGKFYGGGLHKMEPKDLSRISAETIASVIHWQPKQPCLF
jgi:hypothetical protein